MANLSFSIQRDAECDVDLVRRVVAGGSVTPDQVAIITPYAAQNRCISKLVREDWSLSGVAVRDIDGFPVQERGCLAVSFVRGNERKRQWYR